MDNEEKSNMEIALEFIDANPELMDKCHGDAFGAFWNHPTAVIKLYESILDMLKNASQIPQELVDTMKPDLLVAACNEYVNLNPTEE